MSKPIKLSKPETFSIVRQVHDDLNRAWVHFFPSKLGWFYVEFTSNAVFRLSFGFADQNSATLAWKKTNTPPHTVIPLLSSPPKHCHGWLDLLGQFADGNQTDLNSIPLDLSHLTDFGMAVTRACQVVKWGQVASYKRLAIQAGSPNASRAVGGIMANNRFPLIVPCHRITGSNGKLTGFSAPGGLMTKQELLSREQNTLFDSAAMI